MTGMLTPRWPDVSLDRPGRRLAIVCRGDPGQPIVPRGAAEPARGWSPVGRSPGQRRHGHDHRGDARPDALYPRECSEGHRHRHGRGVTVRLVHAPGAGHRIGTREGATPSFADGRLCAAVADVRRPWSPGGHRQAHAAGAHRRSTLRGDVPAGRVKQPPPACYRDEWRVWPVRRQRVARTERHLRPLHRRSGPGWRDRRDNERWRRALLRCVWCADLVGGRGHVRPAGCSAT